MESINIIEIEDADTVAAQLEKELRAGELGDFWKDAAVIAIYTRKQALKESVLIDLTPMAAEAGIVFPVAVSAGLWAAINAIPASHPWESVEGRSWDVIWMLRVAIRGAAVTDVRTGKTTTLSNPGVERYGDPKTGQTIIYPMLMSQQDGEDVEMDFRVKAHLGPGDHAEPVFTLMLPGES